MHILMLYIVTVRGVALTKYLDRQTYKVIDSYIPLQQMDREIPIYMYPINFNHRGT